VKIVRVIARLNVGGPARHVTLLSEGFATRGHEAILVFGSLAAGEGSLEGLARSGSFRAEQLAALGRRLRFADDLRALFQLIRLLRRERPDVVHTHTSKAGTLGRIAAFLYNCARARERRCLVVHTFHGHVFRGYFRGMASVLVRAVERRLAAVTDIIIAISSLQREDLTAVYRIAPVSKVKVVPLGLDLQRLLSVQRSVPGERFGFAAAQVVVVFVGRLVPIKRVDVLVQAIADAHHKGMRVQLLIAGDGECRAALERQARDLEIESSVRFVGWVDDLPALYGAADIVALSSDNEGTPVALIEAAASATPVIATRVGGVPDVITDGRHGILVPPGDPAALAAALLQLAGNADLRRRMGDAARQEVAPRYEVGRLVDELAEIYHTGLRRKRHGSNTHAGPSHARLSGSGGSA
jgi:glycosyltransferase involved in cell wall biosynthesis